MATDKEEVIGMNSKDSDELLTNYMKTISQIVEEERSIKITNPYKDLEQYTGPVMLYNSVADKLSKYGKKRGTNLTPKKKKRKK